MSTILQKVQYEIELFCNAISHTYKPQCDPVTLSIFQGYVPNADRTACVECPAGQYRKAGQTACEDCPTPGYTATGGNGECLACDAVIFRSFQV